MMNWCKYTWIAAFTFVFSGSLVSQTSEELKSWLPVLKGWELSSEVEVFNPDNLFDRINGSAPLYIENNFREMTSLEYKKGDDYITIQAYRHGSPEDAFGMYASERSPDLSYVKVGGEGQGDGKNLFFFAGTVYAKIWSNSSENLENELGEIGKNLAWQLDAKAAYPSVLMNFPAKDKVAFSEAYTTSNYIGHNFLNSVYVAKYNKSGEELQLFVVDAQSKEGAQKILETYFAFTKQQNDLVEGSFLVKDRYNGNIPILWKGRYLIGLFSESGNEWADAKQLLEELAAKL